MKKIMFVGSEVMPYAATGGLGDVLGSLPKELASLGDVDCRLVMPLYSTVDEATRAKLTYVKSFEVELSWRKLYCGVFELCENGVTYYFLDNEYYFKRDSLYGQYDDGERYAFFCTAVLKLMFEIDFYPDILHAHDWQSALAVIYLNLKYKQIEEYRNIKTVFTIHNIGYQGKYDFAILGDVFGLSEWDKCYVEYDGCINLMKGAVIFADRVTTVSPRYSQEILGSDHGEGLQYVLEDNKGKLLGILNGIDYEYYNPEIDRDIAANFSAKAFVTNKAKNKTALQAECGLPKNKNIPLYAIITRLASHKGLDLVKEMMEDFVANNDVQLVVLGKGEYDYEEYFRYLGTKYPDKVAPLITYDRALSKRIYAGADIFIMPSKSEPCGLAQMIASRYGTVPVTRETGGLYDSIKGYYTDEKGNICGNGFTFANYSSWELSDRMYAAKALYEETAAWRKFVTKIMKTDFSWQSSAKKYLAMYEDLV